MRIGAAERQAVGWHDVRADDILPGPWTGVSLVVAYVSMVTLYVWIRRRIQENASPDGFEVVRLPSFSAGQSAILKNLIWSGWGSFEIGARHEGAVLATFHAAFFLFLFVSASPWKILGVLLIIANQFFSLVLLFKLEEEQKRFGRAVALRFPGWRSQQSH